MEQPQCPLCNVRPGEHLTSSMAGTEGRDYSFAPSPQLLEQKRTVKVALCNHPVTKVHPLWEGALVQTASTSKLCQQAFTLFFTAKGLRVGRKRLFGLCRKPRAPDECRGPSPQGEEGT